MVGVILNLKLKHKFNSGAIRVNKLQCTAGLWIQIDFNPDSGSRIRVQSGYES
jgi:hypothetical protein